METEVRTKGDMLPCLLNLFPQKRTSTAWKPDPKLAAAVPWPLQPAVPWPCNIHELRQFLGMSSYYRLFIPLFARMARSLHELTHKGAEFVWTKNAKLHLIPWEASWSRHQCCHTPFLTSLSHWILMPVLRDSEPRCHNPRMMASCTQFHLQAELSHLWSGIM